MTSLFRNLDTRIWPSSGRAVQRAASKILSIRIFRMPGTARMMASDTVMNHSLSSNSPPRSPKPTSVIDKLGLKHAPEAAELSKPVGPATQLCAVQSLAIKVSTDDRPASVPGLLHVPPDLWREQQEGRGRTAAILLSGAPGGVVGPSSMYLSLADKLASLKKGVLVLRLDYRYPSRNRYCVNDVKAAMAYLETEHGVSRFVLVGWSFGGAPAFTLGGSDDRVVAVATVASQTAETEGIRRLAPKPVLLLHGTHDRTLDPYCSKSLYERYGRKGERQLELFEGDDHALRKGALRAECMIGDFIMRNAGVPLDRTEQKDVVAKEIFKPEQRVELMKEGGDLGEPEHVE